MTMQVLHAGAALEDASAALIVIHGRGASAQSILSLVPEIDTPGFAYLAPQADGNTWYPYSFLEPLEANEPKLSKALATVDAVVQQINLPAKKIALLGFSQGACLALEYAARNARRYGGVFALSGGLIGPDGTPRSYAGSLDGTPVFLGCSDVDFHIPLARVQESTAVMRDLGGTVEERIYPGMGHTINQDEIDFVKAALGSI
jgi:phospholipase/carboxylesterase